MDTLLWNMYGGYCIVETAWWILYGGHCIKDNVWWILYNGYCISVPYPKLGLENSGNIELGAAPLVQYYSLYHGLAIYTRVTFVSVILVEAELYGGGLGLV